MGNFNNIPERGFIGNLLLLLEPALRLGTIEWAEKYRRLTKEESYAMSGKFDSNRTPAFRYLYNTCDNKYIWIIGIMKASQIGWTELCNNVMGRVMDVTPCHLVVYFPMAAMLEEFSKKKYQPFFLNCKRLKDKLNIGIPKLNHKWFKFPGGGISLKTLGSISSVLGSAYPIIIAEEFGQTTEEVKNQGDPFAHFVVRQTTCSIGDKKIIAGSKPTVTDLCNVEKLYNSSLQLIFKGECLHCKELIELSGWTMEAILCYDEYQGKYIHPEYNKWNPKSARFECLHCHGVWDFEQKIEVIKNGINYGFIDDTGEFSYGWHPRKPSDSKVTGEIFTVISLKEYLTIEPNIDKQYLTRKIRSEAIELKYSFQYPELLSCFASTANAITLATRHIEAKVALLSGSSAKMKVWENDGKGLPSSVGVVSLDIEQLKRLRLNYAAGVVPNGGIVLTMGIDMQENRFARVVRAWGKNDNSWLVLWDEVVGEDKCALVQDFDQEGNILGLWKHLEYAILQSYTHEAGKSIPISGVSIDSGDNTELVYNFWIYMCKKHKNINMAAKLRVTKGLQDLKYSNDEIYQDPGMPDNVSDLKARNTLAETKGVTVFRIGTHRAQQEIERRIYLRTLESATSGVYYHNLQPYGNYEEQILSCRKTVQEVNGKVLEVYKLISGKRKEAMDAEKNALHAAYAIGLRNMPAPWWDKQEQALYL